MGRQYPSLEAEVTDPENRDGMGAQLDDDKHERKIEEGNR
jgi:hypothetical protein